MAEPYQILEKYLHPGDVLLGRYRLERLVGGGAYGAIYAAIDQSTQERVAVKALPPAKESSSATALGRFQREMKIISSVRHQNLLGIYDYGDTPDGVPFMVIEFLDGITLEQVVRGTPMEPRMGVDVWRQILMGLHAAHELGVVHRDLKPANIMLLRAPTGWHVKVLDFGMAKLLSSLDDESIVQLTREGIAVGTPRYIAPEQARGLEVGAWTDLYAVGLLAYEIFTGERVVQATTIEDAVMAHVSPDPLPLPLLDRVPAPLRPVLQKLLAKRVADRYASAAQVIEDLDALVAGRAPRWLRGGAGGQDTPSVSMLHPQVSPRAAGPQGPVRPQNNPNMAPPAPDPHSPFLAGRATSPQPAVSPQVNPFAAAPVIPPQRAPQAAQGNPQARFMPPQPDAIELDYERVDQHQAEHGHKRVTAMEMTAVGPRVKLHEGFFQRPYSALGYIEWLLAGPLYLFGFTLLTVQFMNMTTGARWGIGLMPFAAALLISLLLLPQPTITKTARSINIAGLVAALLAHAFGIKALVTGLLYQSTWYLRPLGTIAAPLEIAVRAGAQKYAVLLSTMSHTNLPVH